MKRFCNKCRKKMVGRHGGVGVCDVCLSTEYLLNKGRETNQNKIMDETATIDAIDDDLDGTEDTEE